MKKKKAVKQHGGIGHRHLTKVMYIAMVAFALTAALVIGIYSQAAPAQALGLAVPYGGQVDKPVIQPLNAACPEYSVVINADPIGLPIFGVFVPPGGESLLYDYKNLYIPDTPLLGMYDADPNLACGARFPVYPIDFNGLFYFTGTGAF